MDTLLEREPPAERSGISFPVQDDEPDLLDAEIVAGADQVKADPDRFDWSTDDSVLLGEQFAIAVYRNRRDAIVIRQEGVGGDDDHFVILRDAEAVRLIVGALQREIKGEQ